MATRFTDAPTRGPARPGADTMNPGKIGAALLVMGKAAKATKAMRGRRRSGPSTLGAVAIGAGLGLGLALGRKVMVQAITAAQGDWVDALKAEHKIAATLMDKMAATTSEDTGKRVVMLAMLKHALGKHALQEENVIYPALRGAHEETEADALNDDHGYIKTYLYQLEMTPRDSPEWLTILAEFRTLIDRHVREEEDEIYPPFRAAMSDADSKKLTLTMNKEGFKLA